MAERRMFAKTIIDSDAFLDMPQSAQLLYFHLSMRADDDGFINNPNKIIRMIGSGADDMKILTAKKFIIPFESGIVVIKHWNIHNYIAKDRYSETKYHAEKSLLDIDENKAYTKRIQPVDTLETQVRLGKLFKTIPSRNHRILSGTEERSISRTVPRLLRIERVDGRPEQDEGLARRGPHMGEKSVSLGGHPDARLEPVRRMGETT